MDAERARQMLAQRTLDTLENFKKDLYNKVSDATRDLKNYVDIPINNYPMDLVSHMVEYLKEKNFTTYVRTSDMEHYESKYLRISW